MSDFDHRLKLVEKISEARAKFQTIAIPYMKSVSIALAQGEVEIDIPGNEPPELGALSELIRELEDELLMVDPATNFVNATRDYREIMAEARIRRMQNEAYFQNIQAEIANGNSKPVEPPTKASLQSPSPQPPKPQSSITKSPKPEPLNSRKFSGPSVKILAILTRMGMDATGRLTLDATTLDKFCVEADKQKIPTPNKDGWKRSWRRTMDLTDGGKDRVASYLRALMRRNSLKQ